MHLFQNNMVYQEVTRDSDLGEDSTSSTYQQLEVDLELNTMSPSETPMETTNDRQSSGLSRRHHILYILVHISMAIFQAISTCFVGALTVGIIQGVINPKFDQDGENSSQTLKDLSGLLFRIGFGFMGGILLGISVMLLCAPFLYYLAEVRERSWKENIERLDSSPWGRIHKFKT